MGPAMAFPRNQRVSAETPITPTSAATNHQRGPVSPRHLMIVQTKGGDGGYASVMAKSASGSHRTAPPPPPPPTPAPRCPHGAHAGARRAAGGGRGGRGGRAN